MASTTRGSIKISTANGIGAALVDVLGGEGYAPDKWEENINLCGIHAADIESALENIEEDAGTGTERGSILLSTANAIGATLNKKFNTSRGFKPKEWASAASKLEPLPERTASGAIAHIDDGADGVPLKNWLVTLPASLDGYSEVNAVRSGKNLLLPENADISEATVNGIKRSYSVDNREFTFSGTNTKTDANWLILDGSNWIIDGVKIGETYRFSHNLTADFYSQFTYNKSGGGVGSLGYLAGNAGQNASVSLTIPNDFVSFARFQIGVRNTAGAVNIVAHFQLEVGSTATSYEAYEAPTQYTASLGRTIYGGTADIVTGEGEDGYDKGSMTSTYLSGLSSSYIGYEASLAYFGGHPSVWVRNWNYQTAAARTAGGIGAVCNHFPISFNNSDIFASQYRVYFDVDGKSISSVADFIDYVEALETNNDSLDIVYELATPETFTFTPITAETALGVNNFWSDQGESAVTYRKDLDIPDPVPGNLLGMNNVNNNVNEEESEG